MFYVYGRELLGELMLNYLGNVFVPNGSEAHRPRLPFISNHSRQEIFISTDLGDQ